MERKEHLRICKRCDNQKFDINKGIICGLTDDIADFEVQCDQYIPNEIAIQREDKNNNVLDNSLNAQKDRIRTELNNQTEPEKAVKSAASWFYWIAGLSLIGSISLYTNSELGFPIGLGITQLFDGIMIELLGNYSILGFIPSIIFSGVFVIIGYYAGKLSRNVFIAGMIIYGLDTLIFLLADDFLSIGFHIFALIMIYKGFRLIKEIKVENTSNSSTTSSP